MNFYLLKRDESIHYLKKVKISPVFREFTEYQKSIPMDEIVSWRAKYVRYIDNLTTLLIKELNLSTKLGMIDFSDNGKTKVDGFDIEKNIINPKISGKFNNLISTMMYYKIIKDKDYCERDLISQEVGLKRFEMCLKHLKRGGNLITTYFNFCYQGSLELIWLGLKLFEKVLFVDFIGERFIAIFMDFSPITKMIKLNGVGDNNEFMEWLENIFKNKIGYLTKNFEEYQKANQSLMKTMSNDMYKWMEKYISERTIFYKTKFEGIKVRFNKSKYDEIKIFYDKNGGNILDCIVVKDIDKKEGQILMNMVMLGGYMIIEKWWNIEGQKYCEMLEDSGNWLEVETRNHFKIYRKYSEGIYY